MNDPMAGFDQAEAEAVARTDEARREQHWREAEQIARVSLKRERARYEFMHRDASDHETKLDAASSVIRRVLYFDGSERALECFAADYGTPALLRVIADALERDK